MEGSGAARAETVPEMLFRRARRTPDRIAYREATSGSAELREYSWRQHADAVAALAEGLRRLGLGRGDRVAIVGATSVAWEVAQMATLAVGAIAVGLDPNYPDDELRHLLDAAEPAVVFVDAALLPRVQRLRLGSTIVALRDADRDTGVPDLATVSVVNTELPPTPVGAADPAVMVFSSGTTGHPKPIVYTHGQVLRAVDVLVGAFPDIGEDSRLLCWLPLANLFQRMIDFCAVLKGASSYVIDDPRAVMDHMQRATPDLLIGVPRFFERFHAGVTDRVRTAPPLRRAIGAWALGVARVPPVAAPSAIRSVVHRVADALVLEKIRAAFGPRLRYLVSGSAPMPPWLLNFYDGLGLPVYEAYGLSENIVPVAMNRPGARKAGTVGVPCPSNDVTIAADGEVWVRGPGVFGGYWQQPGAPGPDETGYWHTGDLGVFDADGYLRLIGRKSDRFKLSTGRWVDPVAVEQRVARAPAVALAIVLGAARKAVVAIVCLEPSAPEQTQAVEESLALDLALRLSDLPEYQRPAGVIVTRQALTIASGELTTNLKVRRQIVQERFADRIESMYALLDRSGKDGRTGTGRPLFLHA